MEGGREERERERERGEGRGQDGTDIYITKLQTSFLVAHSRVWILINDSMVDYSLSSVGITQRGKTLFIVV